MKKRIHCLILMTTYNGGNYLPQQIDSILNQTYQAWKLIIRDDGSSDLTAEILRYYEKIDKRIIVHYNTTGRHGAYLNFWTLIHEVRNEYSDFDYYFFSDQDDVWEYDKLEVMIKKAEEMPQNKPLLLYGDMRVIDHNNKIIYESLNQVMGIGEMSGYSLFFTHGFLWGCDVCVNKELFTSMPLLSLNHPHIDIMSYDNYMGKYALLTGKIKYIDRVMINHRRHDNNTTGDYSIKLMPLCVLKRALFQLDDLSKTHARVYKQTLILLEELKVCNMGNEKLCAEIVIAIQSGGLRMVKTMKRARVKRKQRSRTIGIYMIALFKQYRKYMVA